MRGSGMSVHTPGSLPLHGAVNLGQAGQGQGSCCVLPLVRQFLGKSNHTALLGGGRSNLGAHWTSCFP